MKRYKIIDSDPEDIPEKNNLSSKKRNVLNNARGSSIYRQGDVSSAVIFSDTSRRLNNEPLDTAIQKEAIREYKLKTESPLNMNEYFQPDRCPLVKSREEIQFWVTTSQPPCLYYSDDDSPKSKFNFRTRKERSPRKHNGLKRRLINDVQDSHSDSSDSTVENYKASHNMIKKNNTIDSGYVNNSIVRPKITLRVEPNKKSIANIKFDQRKIFLKKSQQDKSVNNVTPCKIQLMEHHLNDSSMHVERGSHNFTNGKCRQTLSNDNPISVDASENEVLFGKIKQNKKTELLNDFDSGSSVLTVNYIRSVNNEAKLNGKKRSTKNNKYFSSHENHKKSPQKKYMATDMYNSTLDDNKVLRRNQCENYVRSEQASINRMKYDDKNSVFTRSSKRELPKKHVEHNEEVYLKNRNIKSPRNSFYRPSHDELKKNNEKFLESCRESSSSIENDVIEHHRNKSMKAVSQVVAVKTITSNVVQHHSSYLDDDSSSDNSDIQINGGNRSKNITTHTISFTKVESIQYIVNH